MRWSSLAAVPVAVAGVFLYSCGDPFQPDRGSRAAGAPSQALVGAAASGSWTAPFSWPIIAAHLGVLPDARVISWVSGYVPGDHEIHHVHVWNPTTGAFTDVTNGTYNIFCSGNTFLPDGRLLIPGGHISDNMGLKQALVFNWQASAWEPVPNMRSGRWYPTATTLANGWASAVAGSEEDGSVNLYPEIWDGTGWRLLAGAPLAMPYYPWMHPAPDGRVFNSGPDQISHYLNPSGGGEWTDGPRSSRGSREYGGSIMYAPGKILITGGGDPPTNTAETIDLNIGGGWQPTGSMQNARRQMNSTVLPDGKVLVIGGSKGAGFNNESQPVLAPELWDPNTGAWTTLASMQIPRLYHSVAVLLPDARVLAAGGGRCGTCTADHLDAELFSPPYLFAADGSPAVRPTITGAPTLVSYGQAFTVETPEPSAIGRVTWVRLPATTHAFNQNQWINELAFAPTTGGLTVTAPATAYLAPPGHYMLFVLNAAGVPSVAKVVQIVGSAPLPAPPSAPAAPSILAAFAPDSERVNLTWTDNASSESGFRIERCTGTGCTNFTEIDTAAANAPRYSNAGLSKLTTYNYRVRAHSASGFSAYSSSVAVTTKSTGPTGVPILGRLSGKCIDVRGSSLPGTQVIIYACDGGGDQRWDIPASGIMGAVKLYGLMCLDASHGQGNDGDIIIIWDCHGGANQQWMFTAAGELRGINGKCIEVGGSGTADGDNLYLASCTGTPRQKWDPSITGTTNQSPVANFTPSCTGLTCAFTDASTDADGSVVTRSWAFGDGGTSTQVSPSHTYAAGATYGVTLTVTDDKGATGSASKSVSPTASPAPTGVPILGRLSGKCLDVRGASQVAGTQVVIYACGGGGNQKWDIPAAGTAGTIKVYGLMCLDATGGQGNDGDQIIIWDCHNGPNQQWTFTAAGELKGINGKCITIVGSPSVDGSGLALAPCTGVATQKFDVGTPGNRLPVATFTFGCAGLTCSFTDTSTDPDGSIASRSWTFGDGGASTAQNPARTYAAAGTYTVTLKVTDNGGGTNEKSASVTVTRPSSIVLRVSGRSDATKQYMTLDWTGARGTNVDVYRNGALHKSTPNDGHYTNSRTFVGAASYTYKVCETGSTVCSNPATVVFK